MQHHPIVNYLRLFGLSVGVILFVFMLFRSEQNAHDTAFVKGKPSLQWVASAVNNLQAEQPNLAASDMVAAAPTHVSSTTSDVVESVSANASTAQPSVPAAVAAQANQPHAADVKPGKALGKVKHA